MPVHIIIDGYNFIRQSNIFREIDRQDMELGRNALIDALCEYKKLKAHRITVIFDAANAPSGIDRKEQIKGIQIRYSGYGESADSVIKRMVSREKEKAVVVSSDREITDYSASQGAAIIDSSLFEQKIMMAAYMSQKGLESENDEENISASDTRKKGPQKRLSKKQRKNKMKIGKL